MDTIIFDPTIEQLQKIVAATSLITADDLSDDAQLAIVHDTRISLRDARVTIEKQGKIMRADALKYQKDVIARERELIAIIDPEEQRLVEIENQANTIKERAARAALLPMRKEALAKIGIAVFDEGEPSGTGFNSSYILDLDNDAFVALLNDLTAKKNEDDRLAIEDEKAKLAREAEDKRIAEEAVAKERDRIKLQRAQEESARFYKLAQEKLEAIAAFDAAEKAAQKLIDDAKQEAERVIEEAKERVEIDALIAKAAEKELAEAQEAREKEAKYQAWLFNIGYLKADDVEWRFETTDGITTAFKLVGTYPV